MSEPSQHRARRAAAFLTTGPTNLAGSGPAVGETGPTDFPLPRRYEKSRGHPRPTRITSPVSGRRLGFREATLNAEDLEAVGGDVPENQEPRGRLCRKVPLGNLELGERPFRLELCAGACDTQPAFGDRPLGQGRLDRSCSRKAREWRARPGEPAHIGRPPGWAGLPGRAGRGRRVCS